MEQQIPFVALAPCALPLTRKPTDSDSKSPEDAVDQLIDTAVDNTVGYSPTKVAAKLTKRLLSLLNRGHAAHRLLLQPAPVVGLIG